MKESPGYYAVIPAHVRYSKDLNANQKILFAEISALANKEGFCWARNEYFAGLYDVDERSIQRWLEKLKNIGFITISYTYKPGSKEIAERRIRLKEADKGALPEKQPEPKPCPKIQPAQNIPPQGEVVTILSGGGDNFVRGGGDNFVADNITDSNNINITSSSPDAPTENHAKPPEEEAQIKLSQKIKAACRNADKALILDGKFYPKAAIFLSKHHLPLDYIAFVYGQCKKQAPKSLNGYFYRLFFEDQFAALFYAQRVKPPPKPEPPPKPAVCPICGQTSVGAVYCPTCDFQLSQQNNPAAVIQAKAEFALPEDVKADYKREKKNVLEDRTIDWILRLEKIEEIEKRFGIPSLSHTET